MAECMGQNSLICHGSMVEGTQVPVRTGGSTLEFKSKNLGYYVLKCINEGMYVLGRYKNVKKFSSGKEPTSTYTFHGAMKVHRIIMGQGDSQFYDTIIIVIHEGNPFYFKPMRQKVKKWHDGFMYVASVLSPRSCRSSSEPVGAATPDRLSEQVPPSHSTRDGRRTPNLDRYWRSTGEHEERAPAHLLPDVIDVVEEDDLKETVSPDQPYEKPLSKRNTRKSIYKRGNNGGDYSVVVAVNIDDEADSEGQPHTNKQEVPAHRLLSRQKSRSNEDIYRSKLQTIYNNGAKISRAQSAVALHRRPQPHIYDTVDSDSDDDDSSDCKQLVRLLQLQQDRDRVVVELKKDLIAEGLVFAEIDSNIYIATWKKSVSLQGNFQEHIHIGDQLLQVNDQQATNMTIIKNVIQSSSLEMVKLWIKRLPRGEIIHLTKKIMQPWGFDVNKNEISKVYEGAQLSSHIDTTSKTRWVITELDHQPVSIQSCGKDEVELRMKAAQTEVALVLQPKEFINKLLRKLQKSSIKKKRMIDYIV